MQEELQTLINKLDAMRDVAVKNYMAELNKFTPDAGNPQAATRAGILHDLDKHITNLHMELRRIRAQHMEKRGHVHA